MLAQRMAGGSIKDYLPKWGPVEWVGPLPGEEDEALDPETVAREVEAFKKGWEALARKPQPKKKRERRRR